MNAENTAIVDIETSALPLADLEKNMPSFKASGALKDPAKIAADIEAKRQEYIEGAALSALTGQVVAIGIRVDGKTRMLFQDEPGGVGGEAEMLKEFWHIIGDLQFPKLVGHAIKGFDLPFLTRRSWKLGVCPRNFMKGRYYDSNVVDTLEVWACGTRDMISLNNLSRFLGVGEKSGSGKDFAKLLVEDPAKAKEYLAQDLLLTELCARRMNLI